MLFFVMPKFLCSFSNPIMYVCVYVCMYIHMYLMLYVCVRIYSIIIYIPHVDLSNTCMWIHVSVSMCVIHLDVCNVYVCM